MMKEERITCSSMALAKMANFTNSPGTRPVCFAILSLTDGVRSFRESGKKPESCQALRERGIREHRIRERGIRGLECVRLEGAGLESAGLEGAGLEGAGLESTRD